MILYNHLMKAQKKANSMNYLYPDSVGIFPPPVAFMEIR
jgi:hypothetical protein